jgi:hypothetical protein
MIRIVRKLVVVAAIALSCGAAVAWAGYMRADRESPAPGIHKDAYDPDGSPVTRPVQIGQTILHVVSYNPPTSGNSGPISITDTLSPNQTYVPGSIQAPPGWTWTNPPYGTGNTTTYSHPGYGPGTSFVVNVPVGNASASGSVGGDGFIPILTGGRLYAIFHHQSFGFAQIMCWDASSLTPCTGSGAWPKSLGSNIGTPSVVIHAISGGNIYFPASHRIGASSSEPGIGCWNTGTQTPCAFITLAGSPTWSTSNSGVALNTLMAGIVGDRAVNPTRAYVEANGTVYCANIPSGAPCSGWSPQVLSTGGITVHGLMMQAGVPNPQRLYVLHGSSGYGAVSCLDATTGAPCVPGWFNKPLAGPKTYTSLSPYLDSSGNMIRVCALGELATAQCFNTATGADETTLLPTAYRNLFVLKTVWTSLQIPGTKRVIYGSRAAPPCWDFALGSSGGPCAASAFTPGWTTQYSDYGYRADPDNPRNCLFGLGDAGVPFRFSAKGGTGAQGCAAHFVADFEADEGQMFCGKRPTIMAWRSIAILGRPPQLTGGTMRILDGGGTVIQTIPVTAANTYTLAIPIGSSTRNITLEFDPVYSTTPTNGYQLEIGFDADVRPQICYLATVDRCGPVGNVAVLKGPLLGRRMSRSEVALGDAQGAICRKTY